MVMVVMVMVDDDFSVVEDFSTARQFYKPGN
jgi:hypothetical protein